MDLIQWLQFLIAHILKFLRVQSITRIFTKGRPINEIVDEDNKHVVSLFLGEERLYLNLDSINKFDGNYTSNDDAFSIGFSTHYVNLEFQTIS